MNTHVSITQIKKQDISNISEVPFPTPTHSFFSRVLTPLWKCVYHSFASS